MKPIASGLVAPALIALVLMTGGCSPVDDSPRVPMIVDYSPTVSDVGALIYLLSHPSVEVLAVTLPVTGEAGCELGAEVTLGILAMFERDDIAVACDPERPEHAASWPEAFVAGADALALKLPDPVAVLDERPASRLIADVIATSERPVVVFAVAPLTNIARALELHPETAAGIERLVIMGGAVSVPGNVAGTDAEWNLWIDVPAAARVVNAGVPLTLVPLDATNDVPTPGLWDLDLARSAGSSAPAGGDPARYLSSMIKVFPQATSGGFYLWDELAAAVAAGEDLVTMEEANLTVDMEPGSSYGSTGLDPTGAAVLLATAVPDPAAFYGNFLSTVSGSYVEPRREQIWTNEMPPDPVTPDSPPEAVLGYWLAAGLRGDVATAAPLVAMGAPWVGLGSSPDVFVSGSAPYQAFETVLSCTSEGQTALCRASWSDLWIEANPDVDRGSLQVRAVVEAGRIVEFEQFAFSSEVAAAFDSHVQWLSSAYPDRLAAACGMDGASPDCSELLVETVVEWVADRG